MRPVPTAVNEHQFRHRLCCAGAQRADIGAQAGAGRPAGEAQRAGAGAFSPAGSSSGQWCQPIRCRPLRLLWSPKDRATPKIGYACQAGTEQVGLPGIELASFLPAPALHSELPGPVPQSVRSVRGAAAGHAGGRVGGLRRPQAQVGSIRASLRRTGGGSWAGSKHSTASVRMGALLAALGC